MRLFLRPGVMEEKEAGPANSRVDRFRQGDNPFRFLLADCGDTHVPVGGGGSLSVLQRLHNQSGAKMDDF
ncbi:MAG: hypothetical protein HUU10_14665 [Bacteroidetes bacterium]|nr:hypothetical protein [Bacteroidota bacterium]